MENNDDITLLRDAMDRTAGDLPPLPDLAPLAVREGRRRRARSRFAVGAAALGVVTAGALGLTLLPGADPGVAMPAASAPVGKRLSPEERERREEYRWKMAALLDELLPATVTGVRPEGDRVSEYRFEAGGETFRMVVSVRRIPVHGAFGGDRWAEKEVAKLRTGPISELGGRVLVGYTYRRSDVLLIVYDKNGGAPVSATDLFPVTSDPRFLELVQEADARQMEADDPPLDLLPSPPVAPDAQRAR
ncbi:hypothetical protein [Streptomyces narbonensis]|uniref:hypothetical protein n=1 Tax=Streptomyces narbonensis TaxID=67333 RepID=UPI00167671BC|nr:hypothetical protein [Streptomyces narbonensis]GGV97323.1 hypothetical protein GCM10010230_17390 [Streptomyces narbonensis]